MGIFDDSFSIELNSPIDEESWKVIADTEFDNTKHIYFTTPSGKRVDFIKADVLDKVRAEIEQITDTMGVSYNQYVSKIDVFQIIDKYKAESEGKE